LHFDLLCPGWLQLSHRRFGLMHPRLGRPRGAATTSWTVLPWFSLAKHIGGNTLSSTSRFVSAGSLICSVFKTSAASRNFAARNHSRMHRPSSATGITFFCDWYTSRTLGAWQHAIPLKGHCVHVHVRAFKLTWWRDSCWSPISWGSVTSTADGGIWIDYWYDVSVSNSARSHSIRMDLDHSPRPWR